MEAGGEGPLTAIAAMAALLEGRLPGAPPVMRAVSVDLAPGQAVPQALRVLEEVRAGFMLCTYVMLFMLYAICALCYLYLCYVMVLEEVRASSLTVVGDAGYRFLIVVGCAGYRGCGGARVRAWGRVSPVV